MQKKINIAKILYFYIITFLGILIIFCAVNLNPNNDMWWMISTGRYIVKNREIPKINPFTIHNGYRIIVQQWLTAIFNFEIYIHFGNSGFITTAILMTVLSLFLCYRYISIFTNDINTKMLLISVAAFVFAAFAATRPTIFTIPVVLLELTNLEKWNRDKNKIRYLIPLIFLSILEINIHAALWPLLLILTLPYIVPGYALNFKYFVAELLNRKWLIVVDIFMFLCGFLNPNGVNAMLYLVKSYKKTALMNSILELQKPTILGVGGILLIVQIVFLVLYLREYGANSDFSKVFLAAGTIFMNCFNIAHIKEDIMLFIILTVVAIVAGFVLWELIDEIYLPICLFLGIFILILGPKVSMRHYFYDTVADTETLTVFSDNVYYQNDDKEKTVTICIIDNDKVSHIEAIHYEDLEVEYVKDIPSATVTISTYKRKPKYKWVIYDMLTGDVANVTLQLPESAKNQ